MVTSITQMSNFLPHHPQWFLPHGASGCWISCLHPSRKEEGKEETYIPHFKQLYWKSQNISLHHTSQIHIYKEGRKTQLSRQHWLCWKSGFCYCGKEKNRYWEAAGSFSWREFRYYTKQNIIILISIFLNTVKWTHLKQRSNFYSTWWGKSFKCTFILKNNTKILEIYLFYLIFTKIRL